VVLPVKKQSRLNCNNVQTTISKHVIVKSSQQTTI